LEENAAEEYGISNRHDSPTFIPPLRAFLELSGDEVIDPDSAVQALESISHSLRKASDEEKKALLTYCREQVSRLSSARATQ
jgi:hypothetical protein